jgi:hypothetical protein
MTRAESGRRVDGVAQCVALAVALRDEGLGWSGAADALAGIIGHLEEVGVITVFLFQEGQIWAVLAGERGLELGITEGRSVGWNSADQTAAVPLVEILQGISP